MIQTAPRIEISKVIDGDAWREVMRLRKEVFVEEMGYCHGSIGDEHGILRRANHQGSTLLARFHGLPVGTIAVDWWRGLDATHPDVSHLQMEAYQHRFGPQSLFTVRKWLVKAAFRKTRVAATMIRAVATMTAACRDVHFVIIDCDPTRVSGFAALGFRRFGEPFYYKADQALSVPMCFVVSDLEYLRRSRSPVYRLMLELGQQHVPDIADFFEQTWGRCIPVSPSLAGRMA